MIPERCAIYNKAPNGPARTFVKTSPFDAHLPAYVDEFAFHWSGQKMTDSGRRDAAIKVSEGKRLTYRQPEELKKS